MNTKYPMTAQARRARAQLGNASFKFGAASPEATAARATFEAERYIARVIEALSADHPPLNDDQRIRFRQIIEAALG